MTSVVVFDYGFGNVRSMVRALANLDLDVTLTSDHRQALEADGLVVPGVGAFGACMEGLKSVGGDRVIKDRLRAGRPVLGVCVGEQIMFERGMEHGDGTPGLGLIKAMSSCSTPTWCRTWVGTPSKCRKVPCCSRAWRTNDSISCTPLPR